MLVYVAIEQLFIFVFNIIITWSHEINMQANNNVYSVDMFITVVSGVTIVVISISVVRGSTLGRESLQVTASIMPWNM
jgi:hypothetical protein